MIVCIPIVDDKGLDSPVSGHFGSAPLFALFDTETGARTVLPNRNAHHAHGMCQPLAALAGHRIDRMVVGGIGAGALAQLDAAGIEVYRATHATAGETLADAQAGSLERVDPGSSCGHHGHGHGHGCGHH